MRLTTEQRGRIWQALRKELQAQREELEALASTQNFDIAAALLNDLARKLMARVDEAFAGMEDAK